MTKQDKDKKEWYAQAKSLNARAKALQCECAPLKSRFLHNSSMRFPKGRGEGAGAGAGAGATSFLGKDVDTSVISRINSAKNHDSVKEICHHYRKSISSLRNLTSVALDSLKSLEDGEVSKFDANRRCEKAISSYESEVVVVANKIRVETLNLEAEEKNLQTFLDACVEKFERWEKNRNDEEYDFKNDKIEMIEMPDVGAHNKEKGGDSDDSKEVNESSGEGHNRPLTIQGKVERINALIKRDGGSYGHAFHEDEHRAFLKCWTKVQGNSDLILQSVREHAQATLARKSDDEIVNHAAWYVEYLDRCEKKKQLAREWRKTKEEERQKIVGGALGDGNGNKENVGNNNDLPKPPPPLDDEKRRIQLKLANDRKKAAVREWRESKEADEERKLFEEARILQEKNIERERELERNRYMRGRVQDYKRKKEEERERVDKLKKMVDKVGSGGNVISKEELEKRRRKEIETAKKRREFIEEREIEKMIREGRVKGEGVGVEVNFAHVGRDFTRLVSNTKASKNREFTMDELDDRDAQRVRQGAHERVIGLSGRDLNYGGVAGRRATPVWRKTKA